MKSCKVVLVLAVLMLPFSLRAWTVQILSPGSPLGGGEGYIPNSASYSVFMGYLDAALSANGGTRSQTPSSLGSYSYNSDAVIINLSATGYSYTTAERNVLSGLLSSNVRVLVFGEHDSWSKTNGQLATLLNGSYVTGKHTNAQSIFSDSFPLITQGLDSVYFDNPGKISPANGNGISLSDDDAMTLWGQNDNFLLMMDINALQNEHVNSLGYDNRELAINVANFLAGAVTPTPEPSAYAMLSGIFGLGLAIVGRRRK